MGCLAPPTFAAMQITHTALRHARLLTAGAALTLLATGCATAAPGPESDRDAEVPTEKETSSTAEVTRPELPAAAHNVDESGARAAARYFLELEHYTVTTGDLSAWNQVSLPDCAYCANVVTAVENSEDGERSEGGDVAVEWSVLPVEDGGTFFTRTLVSTSAGVRLAADGAVIEETPPLNLLVDLQVREVDGTWLIVEGDVFIYPWHVQKAGQPDKAV